MGEYLSDMMGKYPDCNFVAVEPQEQLCNMLNLKFSTSVSSGRVKIYNKAVGDKVGTVNLHVASDNSVSTTCDEFRNKSCFAASEHIMPDGKMFKDHYSYSEPIQVETTTIDSLIKEHGLPDFIKIDVEGYEYECLLGLSQKVPVVTFEWHEPLRHKVVDSIRHLETIGFTLFSTEMWILSRDYHDNEINDYKTADEFISWFNECLDQPLPPDPTFIQRSGMVWAK